MKSLLLLALLAAPQNELVVHDSTNSQVTITTTSTGITVQDATYNGTPGHYFIGNAQGTVPYVNAQGGFTIADPKLSKAIDAADTKIVFTFMSDIVIDGKNLSVQIRMDSQIRASKEPPQN